MKVLGLVASPRNLGNSEILVKEMLASLPANIEKEMIRLSALAIQPCKACYACLPDDKSCVIKDQLAGLLDKIKQADAVIIASACYFLGSHTSIKTLSDRMISVLANSADFSGKRCVTVTVYGIPGWEGYAREMVNNFARFLHLHVVGDMLVQAASPGEAAVPAVLEQARQLAAALIDPAGEAVPTATTILACKQCGSSFLQLQPSGKVRCVMCNATGELSSSADGYSISFAEQDHIRFSPAGMAEHAARLEAEKTHYIANRRDFYERRKAYEGYNTWWANMEES